METRSVSIRANTDRLSSLPDSLIHHILSFLPTKFSVATSILARRYRFLWADVVNLDFDCQNHNKESQGMSFTDTISRVMMLSNVRNINSFRLILVDDKFREVHLLESWIRTIIARNVQTLYIQLCYRAYNRVPLPQCLFTCKTLVDLRLHRCHGIPHAISLPNLKRLHLFSVHYWNGIEIQDLISGCPVLEELNIQNIVDLTYLIISSPSIKLLTLKFTYDEDFDPEEDVWDYRLEINTPAARYLVIEDYNSHHITTGTFNSLVEADIRLYYLEVTRGLDLIEKFHHVKCLKLAVEFNQLLDPSFAPATSKFINLIKLELAADWLFLLKLLGRADNLQIIIIGKVDHKNLKRWMEPPQVPTCLSSRLRQITINDFQYLEAEFEFVSYILRHGEVLKMMDIISQKAYWKNKDATKYATQLEEKFNALQRISAFERESKTCKLQFL